MSTLRARKAPNLPAADGKSDRPNPYQQVTDLIIEHLEKGVVPWRCPWDREVGRPRNFHTGKPYRGVNVVLLGCRFAASPWWMTYRQALERGGHVRKGERGALVVKYGTFNSKDSATNDADDGTKRKGMFLRTFTVFNASQIEGIEFPEIERLQGFAPEHRLHRADAIVKSMPLCPSIREGRGMKACYDQALDQIEMPPFAIFESPESFFTTLYHELGHATGHPKRLNRASLTKNDAFGGQVYSEEELVAEMCAAFLGIEAGIVTDRHEQSAAYLSGWLSVLKVKDHRRWIVQAASHASRAADFILGKTGDDEQLNQTPTE